MQTKPHHEARTVAHLRLRTAEVESFFPKIEVVRKRAGHRIKFLEPLFPSYVFLRMQMTAANWNVVRWTPGAKRILGDGERPIEVQDELIEAIWERVEPLGFIRIGVNLERGTRVRIKTGPFVGLEGIFERTTSREGRVRVLLEILGTVRPLEIDVLDLERA